MLPTRSMWIVPYCLDVKQACNAATTGPLPTDVYNNTAGTLTGATAGALPAIDGITLSANDRVLVMDEANAALMHLYCH